jgi:hypothetical protein
MKRRRKMFRASKEVKRRARLTLGTPPASRTHEERKRRPPKHKKREQEHATE